MIDGKSVFYRGYYAMPNLSQADGTPTGGVYGFASLALELIRKLKPDYVAVAWDKKDTNIRKRKEIYPEYKAGRKKAPDDFYAQIPILMDLLKAFNWPLYELDDYEADDIMASLARQASEQGIETCLITSDLDALQSLDPLTHVYALKKGFSNIELFKPDSFEAKFGIRVDQFLDFKSLKGDSSDNIPGVPGIGEKTAALLLQQFSTLDNIYENLWQIKDATRRKLEAGKDLAYMSREVATLWDDAPTPLDLNETDAYQFDSTAIQDMLTKLEFRSLLRNLPEYMRSEKTGKSTAQPYAEITELSKDDTKNSLNVARELIIYTDDEKVWLSPERGKAAQLKLDDAINIMSDVPIVAHDAKVLLKQILATGSDKLPTVRHDIAQGSFLLNPLRKSRKLSDLIGVEEIDNPSQAISALWTLYDEQTEALNKLPKLAKVAREIDFPLTNVLARMEHLGVKLDSKMLDSMNKDLTKEIEQIRKTMFAMVDNEFNISSPAQLGDVLFNKLGLPTAGIKKGKTGYSTGQKELDKLRGQHPIIESIERYRELTKLQNTYVETLPKLADKSGRIHTTFNQDVAATGRLSSTDPNLQNIPVRSEIGRKIRQAFVPEKGNVFVSADYSQFELRLAAVLAGDKPMIEDFNSDIDIHAKTAADVLGKPLQDVTKQERRDAKVINFGVLYGMGPHALATNTGMTFTEAKKFIDDYFELRKPIRQLIDATLEQAKTTGFVETLFGRRRPTPDVVSSNFIVRESAKRAAANMPIQGTEADLMKMAMLEVDKKIGKLGKQLLQIHDSILIECSSKDADAVSDLLRSCMENIYPDLGIKLKVDVTIGNNWSEV